LPLWGGYLMDRALALETCTLETPAFVIDASQLCRNLHATGSLVRKHETGLLFALKSFSTTAGLEQIARGVDGFATSSPHEVRLAARVRRDERQTIHYTCPGMRPQDLDAVAELIDYVSFNSLEQWRRSRHRLPGHVQSGLRINPQLPFVDDERYDPCRRHSKLGIPVDTLTDALAREPDLLDGISGIHVHSNCDATDLMPLKLTVERLLERADALLDRVRWVNLGGGYLFDGIDHPDALADARRQLAARGDYKVYVEPGAAIARTAGYLVASVVDKFTSDGKQIAMLDTTINHMPEVFEYQFSPTVSSARADGEHAYILAGATCLAGDLFGEYRFERPLEVGDRIVFPNRGAYTMVKANMFNGINLPAIYLLNDDRSTALVKRFEFDDYLAICGG